MRRGVAVVLAMACFAGNAAMAQETTAPTPPTEPVAQAPETASQPPAEPALEVAPAPAAEAAPEVAPAPHEDAAPEASPPEATPASTPEPTEASSPAPPAPVVTELPASKPVAVWERCGVLYAPSPGAVASKVVESEHVADLGDADTFVLPADAPANVLAVQCARDAILPEHNDYKVLLAGYPFSILTKDNRVAVLDVNNGAIRLRTLHGSFTPNEQARVQDYLVEAQFAFDKAKAAKKR
jgi:hypothetical protein